MATPCRTSSNACTTKRSSLYEKCVAAPDGPDACRARRASAVVSSRPKLPNRACFTGVILLPRVLLIAYWFSLSTSLTSPSGDGLEFSDFVKHVVYDEAHRLL